MKAYYEDNNLPRPNDPVCHSQNVLKGQSALVTGASSGIGRGVAEALGAAGASVCVNYGHNRDAAEEVAAVIRSAGSDAFVSGADVSDEQDMQRLFAECIAHFGTIDVAVSNAGIQKDAPIDKMTVEQWDRVLAVNLRGQFLCAREAIREFKRRGPREDVSCATGKIICVSSVHDTIPWAGHANYAASKGGLLLMMKSIAQEVAPFRIRVNAISPGAVRTPINRDAWESPQAYASLMELVPYKRIGEPHDIGRCAVWLASDESDYVNGQALYVDGGMTLYPGFSAGG